MTTAPARRIPIWSWALRFLGSFGLAITILAFLFLLTLLGTFEQGYESVHTVQREYFESAYHVQTFEIGGRRIAVPLPGAYLLLALLGVNLLVGGVMRMRRTWSRLGIYVTHVGVAVLLVGGFIEFKWSDKGFVKIYEGRSANEFQSYYEWEVVVTEYLPDGSGREHVVNDDAFEDLDEGDTVRIVSEDLPFTLVLRDFMRNARVPKKARRAVLVELPPDPKQGERDMAALRAIVIPKAGGAPTEFLLWGLQLEAARVDVDGRPWSVDLRKKRWKLPFTVQLDDFQMGHHPGTTMAKRYSSFVTRKGDGPDEKVHITMNDPLRHAGYTIYQSSFDQRRGRTASVFAVVRNPADDIPLIACVIIGLGLLIIFVWKLILHLQAEARRRA